MRPSLDVELRPLLRALETRIGNLDEVRKERCDGYDAFRRNGVPFLHLEIRRDHMHLDIWLKEDALEEARSSGIARPHPFLGEDAVRVRFERAEDLTRVARWLEASHRGAPERAAPRTEPNPGSTDDREAPDTGEDEGSTGGRSRPGAPGPSRSGRGRATRTKVADGRKRAAGKTSARRKPASR